jgi:hypothetical protein
MTVILLDEAEEEFFHSVEHYESKEISLGRRFRDEVVAVIHWISNNPEIPRLRKQVTVA